ncbi:hypothetical protein Adt_45217 [Abeliophyllum distichum]|uniref:Uncharacterized protein n=1 Tax=Abeliophyllum distichum TaxID=126358 RepID=A0ABD1PDR8_9LAMI
MSDIEKEIDFKAEQRIRTVSYNNLLNQLYQKGNPLLNLLGEPSGRSFDYYVLYGMPKKRKRIPRVEKYGSLPEIVHLPTGWEQPSEQFVQLEEAKEIQVKIEWRKISKKWK